MYKSIVQRGLAVVFLTACVCWVVAADEPGGPADVKQPDKVQPSDKAAQGMDMGLRDKILTVYKEQLAVTDEEWTVLRPRLSKVRELMMTTEAMTAMTRWNSIAQPLIKKEIEKSPYPDFMSEMVRGFAERMRSSTMLTEGADDQQNKFKEAMTELQDTLQKEAPSTAEIKARMVAFRGAKEKAEQELSQARKELRELLTVQQEAQLLLMGMLE